MLILDKSKIDEYINLDAINVAPIPLNPYSIEIQTKNRIKKAFFYIGKVCNLFYLH